MAEVSWLNEYKSAAAGSAPAVRPVDVLGLGAGGGVSFDAGLTAGPLGGADPDEQGWQESALCAETDPEAFFPEKGGSTREAKKICTGCEVKAQCLEYALANDERFGIWGGLSERERRRLRRRAV
jgi:WhiB family transcriptional regulator, redox-sensing transcriptional regulator